MEVKVHEAGITQGCAKCRTVYESGNTCAISITIDEDGQSQKRLIGLDPPKICCGERKKTILTFATPEEAQKNAKRIMREITAAGTTEQLILLGYFDPKSN